MNRRQFIELSSSAICAPFILRSRAVGASPRVRKNVQKLASTDPFFKDYGEAIKGMHARPESDRLSWRRQARIHPDVCPHSRPDFVAWHRHYLVFFERICGSIIGKPDFALAYWDWTLNKGRLPTPFFDNGPLNVTSWNDPGGYSSPNWGPVNSTPTRGITAQRGLLDDPLRSGSFTPQAVQDISRLSNFNVFQRRLENSPHNDAHVVSGGTNGHMGDGLSPLDPMFWLHHCNIDRLWGEWQKAGNAVPSQSQVYNGQFVDENRAPKQVTAAQAGAATFEADFGYTYDVLVDPQAVALAERLQVRAVGDQPLFEGTTPITASPRTLGSEVAEQTVHSNAETRIPVRAEGLLSNLFTVRSFRPTTMLGTPRLAAEEARILLGIKVGHVPPDAAKLLVNVFVNCPYLSPATPVADAHYAGSFSFFGANHANGSHERTFLVDASGPLRQQAEEGRLTSDTIQVQLVPIAADPHATVEASFHVTSVEVVTL